MLITRILMMSTIPLTTYCKLAERLVVPKDKQNWNVDWPDYTPTSFSIDFAGKPWADPNIGDQHFEPKWNQMDGTVDRRSHQYTYKVVSGYPLNPMGRTGIRLRGLLGRWGPNHAADPIVTRWKRNKDKELVRDLNTKQPILQFIAIKRRDTKEWALPGGMVDPGEQVSATVKREFFEEALNSLESSAEHRKEMEHKFSEFFKSGREIYRGCVDDPRNTDNAWMETVAINFHDQSGDTIGDIELNAGDDAMGVEWTDVKSELNLYANHLEFILSTAKALSAHW